LALAALTLSATSCGKRFFSATLAGYVREAGADPGSPGAGIDDAEIRVYLEEPASGTEPDYLVKTASLTSGGQSGYWSHKVMWENWLPRFPDEGDAWTFYVSVRKPGYFPRIVAVSGILSDATNVIPTIELRRISMASLRGRVVNRFGQGLDGVRVVLNLASTDAEEDYVATSASDDGETGYFEIQDIAWLDPDSLPAASVRAIGADDPARAIGADGSATEAAFLYIDDPAWYGRDYSKASPLALTLRSGQSSDISATTPLMALSASFTREIVEGQVLDAAGAGINGVRISMDLESTAAGADYSVNTVHIEDRTPPDGWYRFERISWTDREPEHPALDTLGDIETIRIYLDDPAYASLTSAEDPLTLSLPSDPEGQAVAAFTVPAAQAITAVSTDFKVPELRGRVVDSTGAWLNGLRVALDLQSTSASPDMRAMTATVDGAPGTFVFKNIAWSDSLAWKAEANPADWATDTEDAAVYLDDASYGSDTDSLKPLRFILSSGTVSTAPSFIVAYRTSFSAPYLRGRLLNESNVGLNGIRVSIDLESTGVGEDYSAVTADFNPGTGSEAGWFQVTDVAWTDDEPEDPEIERVLVSVPEGDWEALAYSAELSPGTGLVLTGLPRAARRSSWSYTATVSGRILLRKSTSTDLKLQGMGGVNVSLSPGANGSLLSSSIPAGGLIVQTANDGSYYFSIDWSRASDYVPSGPNGGDVFLCDISVDDLQAGTSDPGPLSIEARSWSQTTGVPDLYYEAP
jgi:hypothetical protein